MPEEIYHLNEQGGLDPIKEVPIRPESKLQELVAKYPQLLSGEQMDPENPRRWLLISREQGIADIVGAGERWSVDHLLMDQDAIPTLVEAKLSGNPEIRRKIVGQMMDYAAHATQTWQSDTIQRSFRQRCSAEGLDPDDELAKFLQPDDETDIESFWGKVAENLRSARLRLLFIADSIPDELKRVVEFLNAQMAHAEVFAVEIKRFSDKNSQIFVPRVIGRIAPERLTVKRGTKTLEQILTDMPNDGARAAAQRLIKIAEEKGAIAEPGKVGFSIRYSPPAWSHRLSLAWIYPIPDQLAWVGTKNFTFGMSNGTWGDEPPGLVEILKAWTAEFKDDAFAIKYPHKGLDAWVVSHDAAAAKIYIIAARLEKVLDNLRNLDSTPGSAC